MNRVMDIGEELAQSRSEIMPRDFVAAGIEWLDTFREGSRFANIDDIDDLCKTLSELRKKLRSAGFVNAETFVPQRGVGRGVVYAFCEMHNKCTKCTTDILRNKPRMSKTARKTRGVSTKGVTFRRTNTVAKTTLQTTTQISISSATRQVLDLLKAEPLLSGDNAAQRLGLTRDGFYYHVKILRKAVGLRHAGGPKRGGWEVEKS